MLGMGGNGVGNGVLADTYMGGTRNLIVTRKGSRWTDIVLHPSLPVFVQGVFEERAWQDW